MAPLSALRQSCCGSDNEHAWGILAFFIEGTTAGSPGSEATTVVTSSRFQWIRLLSRFVCCQVSHSAPLLTDPATLTAFTMADAPAEPGTPPPEAQSSIDDRTTSYYMAVSPGQAAAASPGRAGGGATDGADGAPPPSATAAGPPPKLAVHAMTAEDASETAPDVDSGFTSERYFLPAPGDRLVEELTAAELHELRKDSRAVRNRYMHISKVWHRTVCNCDFGIEVNLI